MTRKPRAPVRTDLQEASRPSHMQITKVIAMNSPNNRSIPELFSDAVGQLAKLVGNEFELARAELSEKASQVGRAAAMIGAGAVVLMPALVLLLFAVSAGLIRGGGFLAPPQPLSGGRAGRGSSAVI